jgi:hypothetical protein
MRWLLPLAPLLLGCAPLSAGTVVYVSLAGEKKIAVYQMDYLFRSGCWDSLHLLRLQSRLL